MLPLSASMVLGFVLLQGTVAAFVAGARAPTTPSNVVLIVSDDLGYNEHNWQNDSRKLHTPALDRLAGEGIVLKDYHVQPICSPTRSALMAGRYPVRLGTQSNVMWVYYTVHQYEGHRELFPELAVLG